MFDLKPPGKYLEHCNIEIEVKNLFLLLQHPRKQKSSNIMNWLGPEGLRFVQPLNDTEQEMHNKCRTL